MIKKSSKSIPVVKVLNPVPKIKSYRNNPRIKGTNVHLQYTKEQIEEYMKCKEDPVYFITNYVKVVHVDRGLVPFNMYDYQIEFIRAMHENRKVLLNTARQVGKCVCHDTTIRVKDNDEKEYEMSIGHFFLWQKYIEYFKPEL